jgi:hypothetical protein
LKYSQKRELAQKFRHKKLSLIFLILSAGIILYLVMFPDVGKLKTKNPQKTSFMEYREREWEREVKNTGFSRNGFPFPGYLHIS